MKMRIDEIDNKIKQIFFDCGIEEEITDRNQKLAELGFDSLDGLDMQFRIEKEFDFGFTKQDKQVFGPNCTFADLANLVSDKINGVKTNGD